MPKSVVFLCCGFCEWVGWVVRVHAGQWLVGSGTGASHQRWVDCRRTVMQKLGPLQSPQIEHVVLPQLLRFTQTALDSMQHKSVRKVRSAPGASSGLCT